MANIEIGRSVKHGENEYHIDDLIREGGFGRAFLATRTKPYPKQVVIKVPKDAILNHPTWSKKFAREARILANISHTNVVKIIAYWEFENGERALVQEYVDGAKNLSEYIQAKPEEAPSLLLQALYALMAFQEAASPAVVHRDLSPSNILVNDRGWLKVIDFGLAKEDPRATEILTIQGQPFGTPGCMSPEQVTDTGSVDHRTDLYALGRSFAAALQRRNPQHAYPDLLAEPWRELCVKLSEHDADDRYPTAREALKAAFRLFVEHDIPLAHFRVHAQEAGREVTPIEGWPEVCEAHFGRVDDFTQEDLDNAALLKPGVFGKAFPPNRFFDYMEESTTIEGFAGDSFVPFENADAVGELYKALYPLLTPKRRRRCFRRLCKVAVRMHRYDVMRAVRSAYEMETDPEVAADLVDIVERFDPDQIIEGRGVIPRRPKAEVPPDADEEEEGEDEEEDDEEG